jgi:hypothetical protein
MHNSFGYLKKMWTSLFLSRDISLDRKSCQCRFCLRLNRTTPQSDLTSEWLRAWQVSSSLAFGADLRYEAPTNSTRRFIHGKTYSAGSDVPFLFLLDNPANELFLSDGLGAHRTLSR